MNLGKVKMKKGTKTTIDNYEYAEIDMDYTQVYGCFNDVAHKIRSVTSFKLLFWLLSNRTNKANGMECGKRSLDAFNAFMTSKDPTLGITKRTYYNCLSELANAGIIKKHEKNVYMANMFVIWKANIDDRKEMASHNEITGEPVFHNPLRKPEVIEINTIEDGTE